MIEDQREMFPVRVLCGVTGVSIIPIAAANMRPLITARM
jgi:hypothetical protein